VTWPRDGKPGPGPGQPLIDRMSALRQPASDGWETPRWLPWVFVGCIAVFFGGLVLIGWALQGRG
jgi:hypothetical protein